MSKPSEERPSQISLSYGNSNFTPAESSASARAIHSGDDTNGIGMAINAAKVARNISRPFPLLVPLTESMSAVITLLNTIKDDGKCKDDWEMLSNRIRARISMLEEQIRSNASNVKLHELSSNYINDLHIIVSDLEPLTKKHQIARPSVQSERALIKDAATRVDEEFNAFMTRLQVHIQVELSSLREEHQNILTDHGPTSEAVENLIIGQEEVKTQLSQAEESVLLGGLKTAPLANGDLHESCLEGTRQYIFDEIYYWIRDKSAPQIFWLTDVAGSGKSTIAHHLSKDLKAQSRLAGRFFFSRDSEKTRKPLYFFSTIAQQGLSHLGPRVRTIIADGIRELCDPVSASLEEQCILLFAHPLQVVSSPVVLVLDALDE
ncbi:hypothetical protein CPB86DRAFT_227385 [Serendipita vermifera]|nr:hypothetical protein CPB86DRAFT_227385 [Serendipita vermifera]